MACRSEWLIEKPHPFLGAVRYDKMTNRSYGLRTFVRGGIVGVLGGVRTGMTRFVFKRIRTLSRRYPQYDIGRHSYGNPQVLDWNEGATLKVGAFCSISSGVKILLGGEHRTDWATTYPFSVLWSCAQDVSGHPKTRGDVVIGNDVWIGMDSLIMSGVTIGDGAVVGAGSVVTKSIGPYEIWAGNPATLIKKRFDEKTIQELLRLEWWSLEDTEIEELLPFMLSDDVDAFIGALRSKSSRV